MFVERSDSRTIAWEVARSDADVKVTFVYRTAFGTMSFIRVLLSRTALHWACKEGYLDMVVLLVKNGADKNIRSDVGETPAAVCGNQQILYFLSTGDDIERIMYDPSLRPATSAYAPSDFLRATANSSKIRNNTYDRSRLVTSFQDGLINWHNFLSYVIVI